MWESEGRTWKGQSQGWSCLAGVLGMLWAQPELWGRYRNMGLDPLVGKASSFSDGNPIRLQPTFPGGDARGRNQGWRHLKWDQVPEHPLGAAQGRLTDPRGLCYPLHHSDTGCNSFRITPGQHSPYNKSHNTRSLWSEEEPRRDTSPARASPEQGAQTLLQGSCLSSPFLESFQRSQTQAHSSQSGVTETKTVLIQKGSWKRWYEAEEWGNRSGHGSSHLTPAELLPAPALLQKHTQLPAPYKIFVHPT